MGNLQNKSIAIKYFERFGYRDQIISEIPQSELGIIVVIPSFNEDQLIRSIEALNKCNDPTCDVEVIVVLNASEKADPNIKEKHQSSYQDLKKLKTKFPLYPILENDLPKKHAGVGLARKIGMDEAARRFSSIDKNGVIACFDADSLVDPNYLLSLENELLNSKNNGASICFEHPLNGTEYPKECYEGIVNYELFLRYYNLALKYADLPYCFHTVGSSMAVKSDAYMLQGGMNKRKAGEDFYFLQKIIQTGSFTEINSTKIIPSPRTSDRVPFGTGKAVNDWINQEKKVYPTYDFEVFKDVKVFNHQIPKWWKDDFSYDLIPINLVPFFKEDSLEEKIKEIKRNTTSQQSFVDRFYVYFDAFKMLKLVHWYRDEVHGNQPILEMVNLLLKELNIPSATTEKDALELLRNLEREASISPQSLK